MQVDYEGSNTWLESEDLKGDFKWSKNIAANGYHQKTRPSDRHAFQRYGINQGDAI